MVQKQTIIRFSATLGVALGIGLISLGLLNNILQTKHEAVVEDQVLGKASLPKAQLREASESATVLETVDGDTIKVSISGKDYKVRYIGVDTPETVDPRRPVGCFGKEAHDENEKVVKGKTVILVKDVSETDKFGRLLRYVYLADSGLFVNEYLVREGYAKVATFPPDVRFVDQFLSSQKEARESKRGLWGKCL